MLAVILYVLIPFTGFIADFFSKQAIMQYSCVTNVELLPFLNVSCVFNRGVSFGMLAGVANAPSILFFLTVAILIFIYVAMYKERDIRAKYAYSLIISGALGNIVDRTMHGTVFDFIDFHFANWHYPSFNIADSLIFLGACTIVYTHFFKPTNGNQKH